MDFCTDLPPGFRFHPTDEEIVTHYLCPKVIDPGFSARALGEVDLNKCEPWDLPSKAKMGEKEWYFFCQRDRKYPTGMRTNRATEAGYWKATGKDKEIYRGKGVLVGMKKTLVFYTGRAPKGEKSNWVMHEFRLDGRSLFIHSLPKPAKDEWVVCRVFHKSSGVKKSPLPITRMSSFGDLLLDSPALPPLMDSAAYFNGGGGGDSFDFKGACSYLSNIRGFDNLPPAFNHFNPAGPANYNFNKMDQQNSAAQFMPQGTVDQVPYLHQDDQQRRCKVEQLPNHSMVSDDTGLSTDRNTEISSVFSARHDIGSCASYGDIDAPPANAGPALDLDNMWKC